MRGFEPMDVQALLDQELPFLPARTRRELSWSLAPRDAGSVAETIAAYRSIHDQAAAVGAPPPFGSSGTASGPPLAVGGSHTPSGAPSLSPYPPARLTEGEIVMSEADRRKRVLDDR